jgi:outer membrane protein W
MYKTAISILLAVGPIQTHSGIPSRLYGVSSSTDSAQAAPVDRESAEASPWFARMGVIGAIYHSGATIATNGKVIPGATVTVSNNVTVTFDVGYDITKNISVLLMGGFPPRPTITGQGTVASLGDLGKVPPQPAARIYQLDAELIGRP